jgi:RNase P/RNase MRP subunit POP5
MALFFLFKTLIDESIIKGGRKMRAGNIYQFKHFSKFKTVGEFNDHKERFLQHHPDLFTHSEFIAFEVLSQYSVVVPGVANAKIATLVSACSSKQGGISRATFVRMLRKAKNTGILKTHKTYRSSGGFSHNIFVFQPFDVPFDTQMTHRDKQGNPCASKREVSKVVKESENLYINLENKDLSLRQEKEVSTQQLKNEPALKELDFTFVPDTVPKMFIQTVKPFFDRAVEIYTFWQKAYMAYNKMNFDTPLEYMTSIVIDAFKTTVFHYKQRKIKTSFIQYFYGTLTAMLGAAKRREHYEKNSKHRYNWLDA